MSKKNKRKKRRPVSSTMNQEEQKPVAPAAEAPAPAQEDGALEAEIAPETDALAQAEARAEEYLAMAQRVQADFENFRRRNENVRAEAVAEGKRSVAAAFLDVLDNLERALNAPGGTPEALRAGVELTLRQMTDVYDKLGVTAISRAGEPFDPNLENAVLQGTAEDGKPGTVCQVLQKGYQMNGTVLRYAMVKVVPEE